MYRTKDKLYLVNIFFTIANQHTHKHQHTRKEWNSLQFYTEFNFSQHYLLFFRNRYKKKLLSVISFRDITTQTTTNIPNSPIAKVAIFHSEWKLMKCVFFNNNFSCWVQYFFSSFVLQFYTKLLESCWSVLYAKTSIFNWTNWNYLPALDLQIQKKS